MAAEPSRVGFGGWSIGGRTAGNTSYGAVDEEAARQSIACALDHGITYFDTAPAYGDGRSETLIGNGVAGRDDVLISTKVGLAGWAAEADFTPGGVLRSLETSLERLGRTSVDTVFAHGLGVAAARADSAVVDGLLALKERGLTRTVGVSCHSPAEAVAFMDLAPFDAYQVNLNMLDIRAVTSGLLDRVEASGIRLVARTPLCFGYLSGLIGSDHAFAAGDHRLNWEVGQRRAWSNGAATMARITGAAPGEAMVRAAIRFCISLPGVTATIPGLTSRREVEVAASAMAAGPLPEPVVTAILRANDGDPFFVARARPEQRGIPRRGSG